MLVKGLQLRLDKEAVEMNQTKGVEGLSSSLYLL